MRNAIQSSLKSIMLSLVLLLGIIALPSLAVDIRVLGLFENRAMLKIDGKQHLLRTGQTSPEGVKLLKSSSKRAVIEHEGKRTTVKLSQHIASSFTAAESVEVNLLRGDHGHYFGSGTINGYPVDFMVDTGASSIAMNSQ